MSERTFPWRTLLFLSVAINLLIAGTAVGGYAAGVRLERAASAGRWPGPRAMMAALPQETRAKVRDQVVRTWDETRTLRQQAVQARRDAFDAAASEPFDVVRVRAAFARVRSADDAALAQFHNNMIEAFARMTPEERARAIAALRNAGPLRRAMLRQGAQGGAVNGFGQIGPGQIGPGQSNPGQSDPGQSDPGQSDPGQNYRGQADDLTPRQRFRQALRERMRERRAQQRQDAVP